MVMLATRRNHAWKCLLEAAQFHGSNRLSESRDRWGWAVALIFLLWGAVCIIHLTVSRFFEEPTFMTMLESNQVSRDFPGVLICPEVEFPQYKIDEFMAEIKLPPLINASEFQSKLVQLAAFYSPDVNYNTGDLMMVESVIRYNDIDVPTATEKLTPTCDETILRCRLLGLVRNCSEMFRMELTLYGFCCVFNVRSLKWDYEKYRKHKNKPLNKVITSHTGPSSGLVLVVNTSQEKTDIDLTYKWAGLMKGMSYVEIGINGTPISPNTEHWMAFQMKNINISETTQSLSPDLRKCKLSTSPLKYFPFYSKSNCRTECIIARTLSRCHCIPVSYPRALNLETCSAEMIPCVRKASVAYDTDQCNCPSTCDAQLKYTFVSTYPLFPDDGNTYDHFYKGFDYRNVSIVHVFLNHAETKQFTRSAYFSAVDLFSQLGGVFSVFFGCSILTILELVQLIVHGVIDYWWEKKGRKKLVVLPPRTKKKMKRLRKIHLNKMATLRE